MNLNYGELYGELYETFKICSDKEAVIICDYMCREIVSYVKDLNEKLLDRNPNFKKFYDFDVAFTAFLKLNGANSFMNNFIGQVALEVLNYNDTDEAGGDGRLLDKFGKYLYDNYVH